MTDKPTSPSRDPMPIIYVGESPLTSVYPFPAKDVVAALGQLARTAGSALTVWRKRRQADPAAAARSSYTGRSLCTTWNFRVLYVAALVVVLPMVAATRLRPSRWHERHPQSVFVETADAVLTALGVAFTA
jgi:hypothetical protein